MKTARSEIEAMVPALRRYARALVGEGGAADDLVQDGLQRFAASAPARREGGGRHWAYAILHHLAMARSRRQASTWLDGAPAGAAPAGDLPAALGALPADLRSVLLLVSVEGMGYEEAAAVLDVPVETVRSRLAMARARLAAWRAPGREVDPVPLQALPRRRGSLP